MNILDIIVYGICVIMLLVAIELSVELLACKKRLNNYFYIVNKGFILKNTIFMSVTKEGKKTMQGLS